MNFDFLINITLSAKCSINWVLAIKVFVIVTVFLTQLLTFKYFAKLNMFLISFQPLFIILIFKFVIEKAELISNKNKLGFLKALNVSFSSLLNNNIFCLLLYISIIPILLLIFINCISKHVNYYNIKDFEVVSENIVSYVMTYILPLTTLTVQSKLSDIVVNIILFLIIMILYVRLDLTYLNPVLLLFGYNIYKVYLVQMNGKNYLNNNDTMYIITRTSTSKLEEKLKNNSKCKFKVHSLGRNLLIEC
ncbi:hypothetical protein [Lactobacillus helsingborgensis]|uniref:hypothetical protein n=1 Tax=Lactobacillus helsingborgensis TaxID=1218494 RepID=UPI002263DEE4|nr:hypothetical protein [Lactobacillus helsingborgensis]UZX30773.1 hypothetical protein LDX52_05190 [Lactobacillus helsingborgensis]